MAGAGGTAIGTGAANANAIGQNALANALGIGTANAGIGGTAIGTGTANSVSQGGPAIATGIGTANSGGQ